MTRGRPPKLNKEQLLEVLERVDGDYMAAAVELGVALSTVYRSAERHGISIEVTQERRITVAP